MWCGLSWPLHKIAPPPACSSCFMLLCRAPHSLSYSLYYWEVLSFLCPHHESGGFIHLVNQVSCMPRPSSAPSLMLWVLERRVKTWCETLNKLWACPSPVCFTAGWWSVVHGHYQLPSWSTVRRCPIFWNCNQCWERLKAKGKGGDRGWDGVMASLTQWTWIWTNSAK